MIEIIFLFCYYKIKLYLCSVNPGNKATPLAVSHWPLAKQRKQQTRNGSQPPLRGLLTPTTTSSWTRLTSFNLLTLGIAHASMALLSLNRKFQDLWADKDKWRLAVKHKCRLSARCWNKFSMTLNSAWQFNDSKTMTKGNDNECNRNNPNRDVASYPQVGIL